MSRFFDKEVKLNEMSPLTLAFIGDGVYDLFVREYLTIQGNCPVKKLHKRKVDMVRCEAQAKAMQEYLIDKLTEEENDVYMRGRNAHTGNIPKNASRAEYSTATGLEAIFGYLYLKGDIERLQALFNIIADGLNNEDKNA